MPVNPLSVFNVPMERDTALPQIPESSLGVTMEQGPPNVFGEPTRIPRRPFPPGGMGGWPTPSSEPLNEEELKVKKTYDDRTNEEFWLADSIVKSQGYSVTTPGVGGWSFGGKRLEGPEMHAAFIEASKKARAEARRQMIEKYGGPPVAPRRPYNPEENKYLRSAQSVFGGPAQADTQGGGQVTRDGLTISIGGVPLRTFAPGSDRNANAAAEGHAANYEMEARRLFEAPIQRVEYTAEGDVSIYNSRGDRLDYNPRTSANQAGGSMSIEEGFQRAQQFANDFGRRYGASVSGAGQAGIDYSAPGQSRTGSPAVQAAGVPSAGAGLSIFGPPAPSTDPNYLAQPSAQRPRATLIDKKTGHRIAVDVGSQEAQDYFRKGYVLETQAPTGKPATIVMPNGKRVIANTPAEANTYFAGGGVLEEHAPPVAATLVNPKTGERKEVVSGSAEVDQLHSEGWMLPEVAENFDANILGGNAPDPAKVFAGPGAGAGKPTLGETTTAIADTTVGGIQNEINKLNEQLKAMQAEAAAAAEAAEKEKAGFVQGLKDLLFGTKPSREDEVKRVIEEEGIREKQKLLEGVMKEIAEQKEALGLGLIREGNRMAPVGIIGRMQSTLQQQAAARIGALTAIAQVYQNSVNTAFKIADMIIAGINQDFDDQIDAYKFLIDISEKKAVRMDARELALVEDQRDQLVATRDRVQKNKDTVLKYIMENPEAAQLGKVDFLDTPESAVAKMQPHLAAIAQKDRLAKEAKERVSGVSSDIQEYEYAKRGGFKGSFLDFKQAQSPPPGGGGGGADDFAYARQIIEANLNDPKFTREAMRSFLLENVPKLGVTKIDAILDEFAVPSTKEKEKASRTLPTLPDAFARTIAQKLFKEQEAWYYGLKKEKSLAVTAIDALDDSVVLDGVTYKLDDFAKAKIRSEIESIKKK